MATKRNESISDAVIRRLPRYYRHLSELLANNISRVSSGELGKEMGLTASQVRQDLNHFGGFGQQGYGYSVSNLRDEIARILCIDMKHRLVVIGAGSLGGALAKYPNFAKRNLEIIAIFDQDPSVIGKKIGDLIVLPVTKLDDFVKHHPVDIGVLAIPKDQAKLMAKKLSELGVKGIWNFSSTDLEMEETAAVVENVHLTDSLMRLTYRLHN